MYSQKVMIIGMEKSDFLCIAKIIMPAANSVYKPLLAAGLRRLATFGYLVLPRQQSALMHATAHTRGRWSEF